LRIAICRRVRRTGRWNAPFCAQSPDRKQGPGERQRAYSFPWAASIGTKEGLLSHAGKIGRNSESGVREYLAPLRVQLLRADVHDNLPGGSYWFKKTKVKNKGDGCEGWDAFRSVAPACRTCQVNWESAHQAILHEKFMSYWMAQGNAPGRFIVVRGISCLGSWYGRRFPFFGRGRPFRGWT
jgi:hypothetical protein